MTVDLGQEGQRLKIGARKARGEIVTTIKGKEVDEPHLSKHSTITVAGRLCNFVV